MIKRTIKVKIEKENANRVTLRFLSSNSRMPVAKEEFEKRLKDGLYEVIE